MVITTLDASVYAREYDLDGRGALREVRQIDRTLHDSPLSKRSLRCRETVLPNEFESARRGGVGLGQTRDEHQAG